MLAQDYVEREQDDDVELKQGVPSRALSQNFQRQNKFFQDLRFNRKVSDVGDDDSIDEIFPHTNENSTLNVKDRIKRMMRKKIRAQENESPSVHTNSVQDRADTIASLDATQQRNTGAPAHSSANHRRFESNASTVQSVLTGGSVRRTRRFATFDASGLPINSTAAPTSIPDSLVNDGWIEPIDKFEEESKFHRIIDINDILQFRRALVYMNGTHPFSKAFGRADSRRECIDSAQILYHMLLHRYPDRKALPFEALLALAVNNLGGVDQEKARTVARLFHPDANLDVTLSAFVQSCDFAYKKLRLFRAAVHNSSLLDDVMEQIINIVFYIILVVGEMLFVGSGSVPCTYFAYVALGIVRIRNRTCKVKLCRGT